MATKARIYSNIVHDYRGVRSNPGVRTDPVDGTPKVHAGVDLPVDVGTSVKTPADGQVWATGSSPGGYGNFIIVAHPNASNPTSLTMYGHLKEPVAYKPGESVSTGDELGLSGNTGKSTGPHLHYEERVLKPGEAVEFGNNAQNNIQFLTKTDFINPNANELGFGNWDPSKVSRNDLTPTERIAQIKLSDADFDSYKNQLATIETKGKSLDESYLTTSKSGEYLGRYQLGKTYALVDAGYLDKAGNWTEYAKAHGVSSERDFLASPAAQDDALRNLTDKNAEYLVRKGLDLNIGKDIGGSELTGAGLLAGAHNNRENLKNWVESDGAVDKGDGNGFAISNFVEVGNKIAHGSTRSASVAHPGSEGHWEDSTQYDAMGNVTLPGERVWVPDSTATERAVSSAGAGRGKVNPDPVVPETASKTPKPSAQTSPAGDAIDCELPDGTRMVNTTVTVKGKTTETAQLKGPDGEVLLTAGPGQTMQRDPDTGIVTVRTLGSNEIEQYDPDTETVSKILTATDPAVSEIQTTPIAHDLPELESIEPQHIELAPGKDAEPPPKTPADSALSPTLPTTKVGLQTVELDGQTYIVSANGTLDRAVDAHPGWIETRDDSGGGVIKDAKGNAVAQLQPGDRVGMMDDGQIVINDSAGKYVDRSVDALQVSAFYQSALPEPASAAPVVQAQPAINTVAIANPYSFENYLSAAGQSLRPDQQAALATQLDGLHLGGANDLSFFPVPGGGTLILNADGDAVGEISKSSDGNLHISANTVNADGSAGTVSSHITPRGETLSDGQYAAEVVASGIGLVNSLNSFKNWDQMSDLNKVTTLVGLYNQIDHLGSAFGGSGNNLYGDLGQAAGYLSLVQNLQSGNVLGTLSSINSISGGMIDDALAETFGANIPYLGTIMALNDLESHPGQSIGTLIGMCFGPAGSVIGGMIGGLLDGMGEHAPPPPPEGIIHYQFDASGHISVAVDQDQSGGGAPAKEMGENLLQLMQGMVEAINARTPDAADDLALNPAHIPRVGYSNTGGMWLEVTLPGGLVTRESIDSGTVATRLLQLLDDAGGLAPVWLMDTVKQGGTSVEAVQNHATQSADGKTQSYGAMVIHIQGNAALNEAIQKIDTTQQTAGESVVYRNTDGDAYLEKTQWVSATDSQGNAQGMLVLDLNANGVVETGDILGDMNWLDANKDGVIDASDPAFAAIKLWVDLNQDGVQQTGEGQNLQSLQITGFDLATGQVLYADGSSSAITVETLQSDAAGVKKTEVRVVDEDGKLQTVDAGTLIEHEVASGEELTYEHFAKRTGDWEGTAEQDSHRHGGGNAEGAPTETYATGAISVGPVRAGQIVILSNRIELGDGRVVSDAPTAAPIRAPNATVTFGVGDGRIKSNAPTNAAQSTNQLAQGPQLALIPRAPETVQSAMRIVTQEMIESAQGGRTGGLDLAVLAAIGLGAVQTTAFAAPSDFVQQNAITPAPNAPETMQWAFANISSDGASLPSGVDSPANRQFQRDAAPVIFRHVDLGSFTREAPRATSAAPLNPFSGSSIIATLIADASNDSNASDDAFTPRDPTLDGFLHGTGNGNDVIPLDYPKVKGETLSGMEDFVLRIDSTLLLANDSTLNAAADPTQPTLRIVSVGQPEHGQISLQTHTDAMGRVTTEVLYAPEGDFHGNVSFTYTVSDQYGLSRSATATLQIAAVNDAPVTANENARIDEDTGLILDAAQLLANDRDADTATDGQSLSISRVGNAQHGTASLDAQGNVRFVPDANYHGPAQLTYWVSDGAGGETPATVNLVIAAVNDLPVTVDESGTGAEDVGLIFTQALLLANDSDPDAASDGQVLTVSRVGGAQHGTTWLDAQGNVRFAPDADYHGPAQFNYWVSDGVGGETIATVHFVLTAVNDAPVTANESATGTEDQGLVFTTQQLLANDSDPDTATDGQILSVSRIDGAQHGTAWLDGAGNVRFVPDANYHGAAGFNYWVTDNAGLETMASVNLTIASVNDLPVVAGETVNSSEDVTLLFNPSTLLANDTDTDGNALTISAVGNATHGTASLVGGQVQFVPDANFNGTAGFSYTVNDGDGGLVTGTVVLNLAPVNDTPVVQDDSGSTGFEGAPLHISFASLLANDSDVDVGDTLTIDAVGSATHGTVAIVNGEVVFTPDAGYHGPASFVYRVRDGAGAQATGLATLNFSGVNDMPVAVGETISATEDTTLLISSAALLQNDSDPDTATDGQVLSLVAVSNAQHGSVTLLGNGTIQFIPDPDFYGNASFVYTISDGVGGTAQATATISIANVNDGPIATGETVSGQAGQVLTISAAALLQNEYDPDNSANQLLINSVQSGVGGTVALNGSGDVVFTPQGGFTGTATFTYSVRDPSGDVSNSVTASIVLSAAPNSSPTVQGEIVNGASEDAVFHISRATLLANDFDAEDSNAVLSLVLVGGATNGSVALDGNGDVVFTPDPNFNGTASFQYQVRDSQGATSATVQAIIPVAPVNDLPIAVDDQFQTYKNSTMTIAFSQLTGNDSDVDVDSLTVSGVRNASNGAVSVVGGNVQFVPTAGFTGTASFEYLSDDGHGGQVWATAQVTVSNPPNLYPSMAISYLNFYPTGSTPGNLYDIAYANMTPSDDGNVGAMTIQYVSGSYQVRADSGHAGWQPLTGLNVNIFEYTITSFHMDVQRVDALAGMQTTWQITDDQGLVNIWHFDYSVAGGYSSHMDYTGYAPPLVLALNNMPSEYISTPDSNVYFDMNGDGILDKLAWAAPGSGVLGIDLNGDGRISNASEFAFKQYVHGAQTDLEGLVAFDTNHNGTLDAGDAQWSKFGVWEDKNADGQTQAGEYKTLTDLGIACIDLHSNAQMHTPAVTNGTTDVVVMGEGSFKRTDGSTGMTSDAMFTYQSGTDAGAAEISRMVQVFNQFSNVEINGGAPPLGFVSMNEDVHWHAKSEMHYVDDHAIRVIG